MKKPNVLILFTDQQRYDTLCEAGYEYVITPNLDKLSREGCLYLNAHSTNPVCMPARHDLITGLSARAHGYFHNSEKTPIKDYSLHTLPRVFSENGYRTVAVGKMHFSPPRMHHGFDEMFLMEELPDCRQNDQYATFLKNEGFDYVQNLHGVRPHIYHIPQNAQTDEAHHGSSWVAKQAIDWLEQNEDNPFFMMCGWISPHPPWNIPSELDGLYNDVDLPKEYPLSRFFPDTNEKCVWHGDFDTDGQKRKIREAYFTAVTMVDKNVGKIIDYLKEKGELDNTLVIFTSDHGEMLHDKGYYSKELPFDSSIRVPMIIRYPEKFEINKKVNDFVDTYDVFPTCLDVCELEYNNEKYRLLGESLCAKNPVRNRNYQISSTGDGQNRWIMCRNKRFKYVYYYNDGYELFFDMLNDPMEMNNLFESDNYDKEVFIELKEKALEYETECGPEGTVENGQFKKYEKRYNHPSVTGKMHLWSNFQTQFFDIRSREERGEALINEMEKALGNFDKSAFKLSEVFNNLEWKEDFIGCFERFGESNGFEEKLFKNY